MDRLSGQPHGGRVYVAVVRENRDRKRTIHLVPLARSAAAGCWRGADHELHAAVTRTPPRPSRRRRRLQPRRPRPRSPRRPRHGRRAPRSPPARTTGHRARHHAARESRPQVAVGDNNGGPAMATANVPRTAVRRPGRPRRVPPGRGRLRVMTARTTIVPDASSRGAALALAVIAAAAAIPIAVVAVACRCRRGRLPGWSRRRRAGVAEYAYIPTRTAVLSYPPSLRRLYRR